MSCRSCGRRKCCCPPETIIKTGQRGKTGKPGPNNFVVRDFQGTPTILTGVKEIHLTDPNAYVTSGGPGIAEVSFVPPATVWNDILNIPWYVSGSESFKPQYTIEGNRISFRGLLYLPLDNAGLVDVNGANAYLAVASCTLRNAAVSIISNANTNNGTPQGRFMTTSVVSNKNLPTEAIPGNRDIVFSNVSAFRRYSDGNFVTNYRTYVDVRIGALNTVYKNGLTDLGSGCIMVFSPYNSEYDGSGNPPIGNDPLALGISRVTASEVPVDYIGANDDDPFTMPGGASTNPFSCDAHHINQLGGFIINLEGLSGYLN